MAFSLFLGSRGLRANCLAAGVALSQTISFLMFTGCASQTAQITPALVEVLPAPQMVQTKLGRLAVRDSAPADATGDVLVLWHAVLTDHRMYQAQIEAWRGRHRLIVIDGPGHGGSQAAPGPLTMADGATALAETLEALNIAQPVVVVGTSWGGWSAGNSP
ncbi:MAG: alpha/beta fold hydrolase [Roseomonas sp.]|nr:alpha/beta fold hydrolase [Roseomonas sp.]